MIFRNLAKVMLTAAAGLLVSIAAVLPAAAVDFSGKKITIITPFKEGGGTDGLPDYLHLIYKKNCLATPM